jgi:cytochrome c553
MRELTTVVVVVALALLAAPLAAQGPAPRKSGIQSKGYVWNAASGEAAEALARKGDPKAGAESYQVCAACHLPSGVGRPDGTFPQLAGQHRTVIIKQLADIRSGLRDNPIMYPFAITLTDPQELADVAAYIETLPIPRDNGKGPGSDLERGKELYSRDCASCHGDRGQGDAEKFFPVLAGQHYAYLLRQVGDIASRRRRNANPDMAKVVKDYTREDLSAVADYASRLRWPERQTAK